MVNVFFVEFCYDGTVIDSSYSEKEARRIVRQMAKVGYRCQAVKYEVNYRQLLLGCRKIVVETGVLVRKRVAKK